MVGSEGDGALMASTSGGSGELLDAKTLLLLSNDDSGGALVHAVDLTSGKNKLWTMIAGPGTVLTGKIAVDRTIPLVYVVADGTVRAFDPAAPSMPSVLVAAKLTAPGVAGVRPPSFGAASIGR